MEEVAEERHINVHEFAKIVMYSIESCYFPIYYEQSWLENMFTEFFLAPF